MIVGVPKTWVRIALMIRGSTIPFIWKRILFTTAFSVLVTLAWQSWHLDYYSLTTTPFSLIGVALSIFLGFRNNASYSRFWEGRQLWGSLINNSRNWSRQVLTLTQASPDADDSERQALRDWQRTLVQRQIGYIHALRVHLRQTRAWSTLAPHLPAPELQQLETASNPPAAISQTTGALLMDGYRRGWMHPMHLPVLEQSLSNNVNYQGGCERILSTPVPFIYTVLTHRIVAVYCITLPFGIHETVGWMTPLVVLLISFAFYGLDAIGDEIEEPFGMDPNDLPLDFMSTMIETNLKQAVGDTDLPAKVLPHQGMLS